MSIDELFTVCATRAPSQTEIAACCDALGADVEHALNSIALSLARRYESGQMDFAQCDRVANSLHSWSLFTRDRVLPEPAYQVFLAFDEGEYHHRDDPEDVDPEAKYTRPMIEELLRGVDAV